MIYGEWAQRIRTAFNSSFGPLKKWPREKMQEYGPWFLYGLFFGILMWEVGITENSSFSVIDDN